MKLQTYIKANRGEATRLAALLKIAPSYLSQMSSGYRAVPAQKAFEIVKATKGSVTLQDLRPDDYWLIWPDLKAPADAKREKA